MKLPALFFLGAAIVLGGCDDKSATPSPGAGSNTSNKSSVVTAPVDYLGAVVGAQQSAIKTVDTVSLNQAVQQFAVEHGRNPKDLNELVQEKYIPKLPQPPYGTKIVYEASTGTVSIQKE